MLYNEYILAIVRVDRTLTAIVIISILSMVPLENSRYIAGFCYNFTRQGCKRITPFLVVLQSY